jgi:hypothetical protein
MFASTVAHKHDTQSAMPTSEPAPNILTKLRERSIQLKGEAVLLKAKSEDLASRIRDVESATETLLRNRNVKKK